MDVNRNYLDTCKGSLERITAVFWQESLNHHLVTNVSRIYILGVEEVFIRQAIGFQSPHPTHYSSCPVNDYQGFMLFIQFIIILYKST